MLHERIAVLKEQFKFLVEAYDFLVDFSWHLPVDFLYVSLSKEDVVKQLCISDGFIMDLFVRGEVWSPRSIRLLTASMFSHLLN